MKLWIARNRGGLLQLFPKRPIYIESNWRCDLVYNKSFILDIDDFPEVTFENSPQEVEIKLKHYEQSDT